MLSWEEAEEKGTGLALDPLGIGHPEGGHLARLHPGSGYLRREHISGHFMDGSLSLTGSSSSITAEQERQVGT